MIRRWLRALFHRRQWWAHGTVSKKKSSNPDQHIFTVSTETSLGLIATLSIAAIQAMGYTVTPWVAIPCWLLVAYCVLDVIWRHLKRGLSVRLILTGLLFVGIGSLIYRSIVGPIVELGTVKVFFSESRRFPAVVVPFDGVQRGGLGKLASLVASTPPQIILLRPGSEQLVMSVIVQNASNIPIRNAHISIISTSPIEGKSMSIYTFSPNEISTDIRELPPYDQLTQENDTSVEFEGIRDGLLSNLTVTVEADNMKPFVGIGKFKFIVKPQ
jgi:hypothetical protein